MKRIVTLASKNITRSAMRSTLTSLAIALGVFFMINALSYVAGIKRAMVDVVVSTGTGHIQIHREGYLKAIEDRTTSSSFILDRANVEQILTDSLVGASVKEAAYRFIFSGMAGNGEETTYGMVMGVSPSTEKHFFTTQRILEGRALSENGSEVVISERIARVLGLSVGDVLMLAAQTPDGFLNAADYRIAGIFSPGTQWEFRYMVDMFMTFEDAEVLMYARDQVTEVALLLNDEARIPAVMDRISGLSSASTLPLETHRWEYLGRSLLDIAETMQHAMRFWTTLIFLAIAFTILNTFWMAVYERTQEIGILRAIGISRKGIIQLFFFESFLLCAAASLVATAVSFGTVFLQNKIGVPPLFDFLPDGKAVHPFIKPDDTAISLAIALVITMLASMWPARKAARLEPIEALRYE